LEKLAVFDFDGTLFNTQTIPFFIEQWDKLNYPKGNLRKAKANIIKIYFLHKFKLLNKENFRSRALSDFLVIFNNMNKEDIDEFFRRASKDAPLYFNKKILKELTKAKENHYHTVILSGCYENFLQYIANDLNINSIIGSKIQYDQYTKVDYSNPVEILSGKNKVESLIKRFPNIDFNQSIAYADSHTDIELLKRFSKSFAVNPDEKLREVAKNNNWDTIE